MPSTKSRVLLSIDEENCKGCGLCVQVCPRKAMGFAIHINSRGFHPACLRDADGCTGCAQCAIMCPDACVKIVRLGRR
ncbi:MAG: ferredoxin family protein [Armatimonadota bacterium]